MTKKMTTKMIGNSIKKWEEMGRYYGYPKCCIDYFCFRMVLRHTFGILIPCVGSDPCLCPECGGMEREGLMLEQLRKAERMVNGGTDRG